MDYTLCIGCRYCQVACPYNARVFNWNDPIEATAPRLPISACRKWKTVRAAWWKNVTSAHIVLITVWSADFVPGVDEPATPACVVACPTGARVFGDLTDPTSPISMAQVEASVTLRLREDLSTEPRVYYVSPVAESKAPFIQNVGR